MNTVDTAYDIAKRAHKGQLRLGGEDYISHPERVVEDLIKKGHTCDIYKIVGYIHDVAEDHPEFLAEIVATFSPDTVAALDLLTRKHGETYFDFIQRILESFCTNSYVSAKCALMVKISDLEDNMRDLKEGSMKDKYRFAHSLLSDLKKKCLSVI